MSFLLGGDQPQNTNTPNYTGLAIQTSTQGIPIQIVYGQSKIAPNIIWYGDFKKISHQQGGGKGLGSSSSTSYTYQSALVLGLCEGPIAGIGSVWASGALSSLSALDLTLFTGTASQSPWCYLSTNHPTQALSYPYTAYVASGAFNLGSSPDLPDLSFEVTSNINGNSTYSVPDANPADIIVDLFTNPQYAIAGLANSLDSTSLQTYRAYCAGQSLLINPVLTSQESMSSVLDRWANLTNTWIFWDGQAIKFVPLGDTSLSQFGFTYNPPNTAVFELTPDDFMFTGSDCPVQVSRKDQADCPNYVKYETLTRTNAYNVWEVTWQDQNLVDQYGEIDASVTTAHEFCNPAFAQISATLYGQRQAYLKNTYQFTIGQEYILLEPGDIGTIYDPFISPEAIAVRLTEIKEDDKGNLQVQAEEYPGTLGIVQSVTTNTVPVNYQKNTYVSPGSVNPPAIFEPSTALTGGIPQVWIGASGGPNWGGCLVYLSFDGTNYSPIGTINSPIVQGVLTADLPLHSDPDTTDTLAVNLTESLGTLSGDATNADADAFRTLCLVGPTGSASAELICYGSATLSSSYNYSLTYLRRGVYSTGIADHPVGTPFSRVTLSDQGSVNSILAYNLPQSYVGQTLYFKLTSFNLFGTSEEELSSVTQYTYTPSGVGFTVNPPSGFSISAGTITGGGGSTSPVINATWTGSTSSGIGSYQLQWSTTGGSSWSGSATVPGSATSYTLAPAIPATTYELEIRAVSSTGIAVSVWVVSGSATTGSGSGPTPSTISLTGDVSGTGASTIPTTLATVLSSPGTYGSASSVPSLTVNGKGLITAISANALAGSLSLGGTSLSLGGSYSTLAGPLTITGALNSGSLNLTGSTAPANGFYLVSSSPNTIGVSVGSSTFCAFTGSGFYIGETSVIPVESANEVFQVMTTGAPIAVGYFNSYPANQGTFRLLRSLSNSVGSHSAVTYSSTYSSTTQLGNLFFDADDGTSFNSRAASINVVVGGTVSTGSVPGQINFATTSVGQTSPSIALTIDAAQTLYMGNSVYKIADKSGNLYAQNLYVGNGDVSPAYLSYYLPSMVNNGSFDSINVVPASSTVNISTTTTVSSGNVLTFASTSSLTYTGCIVTGSTNIPVGAYVVSFTSTTVTLNVAITGTISSGTSITFTYYASSTGGPAFGSFVANGTYASKVGVATGAAMATYLYGAYDGSNMVLSARLYVATTGTISAGIVPSDFIWQTTSSSGVMLNAMCLTSSQSLQIGPSFLTIADSSGNLYSRQLFSSVAVGTPPLVVTSTTNVPNLNASSLNGATFAAPGPIGSTTPSTGAFTTLSATSTVSGAGFTAYMASPPAIGQTAANSASFTQVVTNQVTSYVTTTPASTGSVNYAVHTIGNNNTNTVFTNSTTQVIQTFGIYSYSQSQYTKANNTGTNTLLNDWGMVGISQTGAACTINESNGIDGAVVHQSTDSTDYTIATAVGTTGRIQIVGATGTPTITTASGLLGYINAGTSVSRIGQAYGLNTYIYSVSGSTITSATLINASYAIGGTITNAKIGISLSGESYSSFSGRLNLNGASDDGTTALNLTGNAKVSGITLIGSSTTPISSTSNLQVVGTSSLFGFGSTHQISAYRSNGTQSTPTVVTTGQTVMNLRGLGYDGSSWNVAGAFQITAGSTIGGGITSGNALILTANSSGTNTIALTIDSSQNLNVGPSGTTKIADSSGNLYAQTLTIAGNIDRSYIGAISAAGTTQSGATALTKDVNVVSTVGAGAGVQLPAAVGGMVIRVRNTGANALLVYPVNGGSAAINNLGTNVGYSISASGGFATFVAVSSTQWYTF